MLNAAILHLEATLCKQSANPSALHGGVHEQPKKAATRV